MRMTVRGHARVAVEAEVDVLHLGTPARRSGHPDSWAPAEPPELEVVRVVIAEGPAKGTEIPVLELAHEDLEEIEERALSCVLKNQKHMGVDE